MASASDFAAWAQKDLVIPFEGQTYRVCPPDVDRAGVLLACAIRAEVNLGLVAGPIPEGVQEVLDSITDEHPALTEEVYQQMVANKVPKVSIDRFAYYATFFWARGEEYADMLARLMFTPRVTDDLFPDEDGGDSPKV